MLRNSRFLLLAGLAAAACSETPEGALAPQSLADSPDTRAAVVPAEARASAGLEPVGDWRDERKRIAMLGLTYDSGRAVPVASEVPDVLAGLRKADVPRLIEEGRAAFAENRALDAIPAFTRVVLLEPEVADHYVELGAALYLVKLEKQTIAAFETGLEIDPSHAELNFRVADMADRANDDERAVALYERAIALDATHGRAWGRLARIHFFEQSDDAAWQAIHRAEDLGEAIPVQMKKLLSDRTPEPAR